MQVKIAAATPAPAFNLTKLSRRFRHKADGSGVFESGQHPIIVGQAAYNSAYGTNFAASGNCNTAGSTLTSATAWSASTYGTQPLHVAASDALKAPNAKMVMIEPKAIHDEMNSTTFDEFGRMQANLGHRGPPPTPGLKNVTPMPYVNPRTRSSTRPTCRRTTRTRHGAGQRLQDHPDRQRRRRDPDLADHAQRRRHAPDPLPPVRRPAAQPGHLGQHHHPARPQRARLEGHRAGQPAGGHDRRPAADHPRTALGDAERHPAAQPDDAAVQRGGPAQPAVGDHGVLASATLADALGIGIPPANGQGEPVDIVNHLVNFGWEYVFHCHILSHEEMDMMQPVSVAYPPCRAESASTFTDNGDGTATLAWNDNSIAETAYVVQRTTNGTTWTNVGNPNLSPLNTANTAWCTWSITDTSSNVNTIYGYRVAALNTVGYLDPAAAPGTGFPTKTVQSVSDTLYTGPAPTAPTNVVATLQAGPQIRLTWNDTATTESGFVVQLHERRPVRGDRHRGVRNNTGSVTYVDTTATAADTNTIYVYQVAAINVVEASTYTPSNSVLVPAIPAAPTGLTAASGPNGNGNSRSVSSRGLTTQPTRLGSPSSEPRTRASPPDDSANVAANATTLTQTGLSRDTEYWYRIRANNGTSVSSAWVNATPLPIRTNPSTTHQLLGRHHEPPAVSCHPSAHGSCGARTGPQRSQQ